MNTSQPNKKQPHAEHSGRFDDTGTGSDDPLPWLVRTMRERNEADCDRRSSENESSIDSASTNRD